MEGREHTSKTIAEGQPPSSIAPPVKVIATTAEYLLFARHSGK